MNWFICLCIYFLHYEGTQALDVSSELPDSVSALDVSTVLPDNVAELLNATDLSQVSALLNASDEEVSQLNSSRRIINGEEVYEGFQYMVYLKLAEDNVKKSAYKKWLCAGVIVHEEYVLTSAACIEDAQHFYVISGTYKYSDKDTTKNNACIRNGRKKAIWKCVPKNYMFDGHENDNLRWMNNDIAVVRVSDGFDFKRRIKGCQFVPAPILYNNNSRVYESAKTIATIAGWGTTSMYNDWMSRRMENQPQLLQATVELIEKRRCKRRWGKPYNNIIDNYMICSRDMGLVMSDVCQSKYVQCKDLDYSSEESGRRTIKVVDPDELSMHTYHNGSMGFRRQQNSDNGGFCENDHGGPLIYGTGDDVLVIGIISACRVHVRTNKCYGPFLYTSVFKNRQFINCAIYKEAEVTCRRQFRHGVTHTETTFSWENVTTDGPDKPVFDDEVTTPETVPLKVEADATFHAPLDSATEKSLV